MFSPDNQFYEVYTDLNGSWISVWKDCVVIWVVDPDVHDEHSGGIINLDREEAIKIARQILEFYGDV